MDISDPSTAEMISHVFLHEKGGGEVLQGNIDGDQLYPSCREEGGTNGYMRSFISRDVFIRIFMFYFHVQESCFISFP